jgi:hypothetical protein
MQARAHRLLRLGLPAVAVLALTLGGCADPAEPVPSSPPASPSASPSPSGLAPSVSGTGSDGLTVRYLDADGGVKTVRVEDFPR